MEFKHEELQLCQHIEATVVELSKNLSNRGWQEQMATLTNNLRRFESMRVEGQRLRSKLKWKHVGD